MCVVSDVIRYVAYIIRHVTYIIRRWVGVRTNVWQWIVKNTNVSYNYKPRLATNSTEDIAKLYVVKRLCNVRCHANQKAACWRYFGFIDPVDVVSRSRCESAWTLKASEQEAKIAWKPRLWAGRRTRGFQWEWRHLQCLKGDRSLSSTHSFYARIEIISPFYWKRHCEVYPKLSALAKFSVAGLVKNSRRSSIALHRLNRLCFVQNLA